MVNVAYIQSPYHARILKLFIEKNFNDSEWIIFSDERSVKYTNDIFPKYKKRTVKLDLNANKKGIQKKILQLQKLKYIRVEIKNYISEILYIVDNYGLDNFIFFSEKNIFSQIVLSNIHKETTVWCIDEGFGHYIKAKPQDRIIKEVYGYIFPFLINFKYIFFRELGTHPRINRLALRLPNKKQPLNDKISILSYEELNIRSINSDIRLEENDNKDILILTIPSEMLKKSEERIKTVEYLIKYLKSKNYSITLKPHPLEDTLKYSSLSISILNKEIPFEDINFYKYKYIFSDVSSSLIDLLASNFPKNNIFIYNLKYSNISESFFSGFNIIDKEIEKLIQ